DPVVEEIDAGDVVWRFDREFLASNWTCIWGRGCRGILAEPAEHLGQGCCSIGADLGDEDEARMIAALAATLAPTRFEHHAERRWHLPRRRPPPHSGDRWRVHLPQPARIRGWCRMRVAPRSDRRRRVTPRVQALGLLAI